MQSDKEIKEAETMIDAVKAIIKKGKQEISERINPATTGEIAAQIKKYAKWIYIACTLIIVSPFKIPGVISPWLEWLALIFGIIAGVTSLDKSKLIK